MNNYTNREWLYREKITNDRSVVSIAKECKVATSTITTWLSKFGITYKVKREPSILVCNNCNKQYESRGRKSGKDGKFRCRKCQNDINNARPNSKKSQKKYYSSDEGKLKRKEWQLKRHYNITLEEYDARLRSQNGVCAICKNIGKKKLSVDHDHNTGIVRGLLCDQCNMALGLLGDSTTNLQNALNYLQYIDHNSWDTYFLSIAALVSTRSKDPSTKVGAVIVRPDKTICSVGYNGFPRGMKDRKEWLDNREEKYSRVVHGEINALLFARGENVDGYTLYTYPFLTCDRCFSVLVQAGIKRFVAPKCPDNLKDRWEKYFIVVRERAKDMGIILEEIGDV